jgi:hypothetical protein
MYFVLAVSTIVAILNLSLLILTAIVWNRVIGLLQEGNRIFQKTISLLKATETHADITDTSTRTAAKRVEELEKRHEKDASILITTTTETKESVKAVREVVDVIKDTVTASDTGKH